MSKENYEALAPAMATMEENEIKAPNMPVNVLVQEAGNLHEWSKMDQSSLLAVGLPATIFDELQTRMGALRYAESIWFIERNSQAEAELAWKTESKAAFELRDELVDNFRYAFRNREDLLSKVKSITEGTSDADLIQDLSDLALLGKGNTELLSIINFDTTQLDTALTLAETLTPILAAANGEEKEDNIGKVNRDKVFTLLKSTMDEVRSAGKFAFRKDQARRKGYFSAHWSN